MTTTTQDAVSLEQHGIVAAGRVIHNPTTSQLYEAALRHGGARLADGGPLAVDTGRFTGRSPQDKFVVDEPGSRERIWWGSVNQPLAEERYERAAREGRRVPVGTGAALCRRRLRRRRPRAPHRRPRGHRQSVPRALRVRRCSSNRRPRSSVAHTPDALVLHAPEVEADPESDGTRTGTFVGAPPVAHRGAGRRDVLRRRDQEVDLHGDERPAAARGRVPDALLGERRRRRRTWRCSSGCPARARRRSRPTPSGT